MDRIVGVYQPIIRAKMNCTGDIARRSFNTPDVALRLEPTRYLDAEINHHRLIAALRMVIKKQIVPWAQFLVGAQECPDFIKSWFPSSGDITDPHGSSDASHQFCARSFHHDLIFHGHPGNQ